ncbi:MAG TPA: PDGLE domain-containing protein [Acidimicrobiales bacterium]|jgi:hypothetical protein|nr:PDGLE domain-containing protein [Acidimicrobiales bacterium]
MRSSIKVFVVAGLLVGLALAVFVGPYASTSPDGLTKVSAETGFASTAQRPASDVSPLAGYSTTGIHQPRASKAVAGLVGTLATFGVGVGSFALIRRRRRSGARALEPAERPVDAAVG